MDRVLSLWARRVEREFGAPLGLAMAYALESPGKRLRPALLTAAYRAVGGGGAVAEVAAAVEVVHSYSLVHDDLPCMDDDDMRRGRPTLHRRFDTRTATEAGYRMIPLSARVLASGVAALGLGRSALGALGLELFRAAGVGGMVGGQVLDLVAEGQALAEDDLIRIHRRKTGALIAASVVMGAIAAGAEPARVAALRGYGEEIGLAFQIADDLLDQNGTSTELGKTAGKDARRHKPTFATMMDRAAAGAQAARHVERGVAYLRGARIDSTLLNDLAQFIVNRRS